MTTKRVYIEPGGVDASDIFRNRKGYELVNRRVDSTMLVLLGGGDLNPKRYGEQPISPRGWYNDAQDEAEIAAFEAAGERFKFGICRGGQLLNVLNGGKLWQHIEGHGGNHEIYDRITGQSIITSSVHHQQFRVTNEALVVATCNVARAKFSETDRWNMLTDEPDDDVEVCWYPKTRSLCVQGHPEFGPDQFTEYCFELIERYY